MNHKKYGGAWSIYDKELISCVKKFKNKNIDIKEFCIDYKEWIANGKNLKGWSDYSFLDFSNGTTETFDKFYQQYSARRLRLMKGEYFYHQLQARLIFKNNFAWIEDGPLVKNDMLVLSCPFSDTGNIPENFEEILTRCDELAIPVLLDMAYISISDLDDLNLTHPSIEVIATSLSKFFPVEHHRIGLRMRRTLMDDTLTAYNQNHYVNQHSVGLGHHMISSFKNNWLIQKYKSKQLQICQQLDLEPSSCVIFGLDRKNNFKQYNRGGNYNRLCFSRIWDGRITQDKFVRKIQ